MPWIKKNLALVVAGVVAAALFAAAGYFLWFNAQKNALATEELEKATAEVERVYNAKPSINEGNLQTIVQDQKRVESVMELAKSRFNAPNDQQLGIAEFKKLLDETLFEITRDAEAANVSLPPKYNFTFEIQKSAVNFVPGSIPPLAARLGEIKSICQRLFAAKVHSVDRIRRVIVSTDDREGSPDYLIQKPVTNELAGMVRIPYEVTFTGFTKELAAVMTELSIAREFFVVRNLVSEVAPPPVVQLPAQVLTLYRPLGQTQPPPVSRSAGCGDCCSSGGDCCGGGGAAKRPAFPLPSTTQPLRYAPPALKASPNALLDERLLRFTLALDVIIPISTNAVPTPESSAGAASSTGAN